MSHDVKVMGETVRTVLRLHTGTHTYGFDSMTLTADAGGKNGALLEEYDELDFGAGSQY